ncbi:transmembrane GTPase fzo-like [Lytechinus variegatus]|uniref:transmembrane GTPase fzo-like n=1 Tax=Lytechinus variegatus TaxID=7654 RepID=UPI001BB2BB07|nr:transmembrane GTPase fzo-like [Lytechinus variegatus]
MAANAATANSFMEERENQQRTYDVINCLITNVLDMMSTLEQLGMKPGMILSFTDCLNMEKAKIESLKTCIFRKKMKVTIFGPTSSGKSTLVNAILGKELLACGMGHTTNCFLQIEQVRDDDDDEDDQGYVAPRSPDGRSRLPSYSDVASHFIIRRSQFASESTSGRSNSTMENFSNPLDIQQLHDLSDATSETSLDISRYIEIFLAKNDHKCSLLRHFLQILDCPGISTCRDIGDKVKAFCGDADLHVLVISTIAGITAETKEHFLKVKERLPHPDIIIGFTQWDLAANDKPERKERVKNQHLKSAFDLLSSTGTVSTMEESRERCFFISGSEALGEALGEQMKYTKGQEERSKSFQDFLQKIEERASIAGKKDKLDTNRDACREIIRKFNRSIIDTMIMWIEEKRIELQDEIGSIEQTTTRLHVQKEKFLESKREHRERIISEVDDEVMECLDDVNNRMEKKLGSERNKKALDSYLHEHGEAIIQDWYKRITKRTNRATRDACEDYSINLLDEYRKCFREFPHDHPRAYVKALHEEIFQKVGNEKIDETAVDFLLKGITDRGIIGLLGTSRKHHQTANVQEQSVFRERQRMAAGAGVRFLRVRKWLWGAFEDKLMKKFEKEGSSCLVGIKESCRRAIEEFCDTTEAYYNNQVENGLELQFRSELQDRRSKIDSLSNLTHTLNTYRQRANEIGWQILVSPPSYPNYHT